VSVIQDPSLTKLMVIARFMRIVTIVGPFAEVGPEQYAHTPFSQIYAVPEFRGLFKLMYVAQDIDISLLTL
jgi:hypothetical protein